MASSYVPLHLRSNYSLLSGASPMVSLLDRAVEIGLDTLALTDLNNLYAATVFKQEAEARAIRPILGVTLEHETGSGVLLARNLEGYRNLCRIVTERQLNSEFRFREAVGEHAKGLHFLIPDPRLAAETALHLGPDRVWLLLEHPAHYPKVRDVVETSGLRPVAAPGILFARPGDHGRHRLLTAIRLGATVSRVGAKCIAGPEAYLQTPEEMRRRWRDLPEALENSRTIAEACRFEIPGGRWVFPRRGEGAERARERLRQICREGLRRRYGRPEAHVEDRLERELGIIERLGFTEYFLITGEIVRFARGRRIPTVGRGSGAGSLVSYLLGITNVDPIVYGLCFERFLHEGREDCPDLDIDFCWRGRDEVIEHVYETYGGDRVAMISTHVLFRPRSAFRETAKAFGLSTDEITVLSKRLRRRGRLGESMGRALGRIGDESDRAARILHLAGQLIGFPRHLGIHSGGLVIADTRLDDYLSLEGATKGIVVTQPDMHGVEALGLVKMDLLGNRALSTIRETVELVAKHRGTRIEPGEIPDGDEKAGDLLASGATLGCFQIESPGMRSLLGKLRVRSLDGTIAALSLIRPGPAGSGMKEAYVRRANALESATAWDPRLKDLLADTHGVMLYQEDVMRVASALTGVSLAEADLLRRAIAGARSRTDLDALGGGFVRAAVRNGFREDLARAVWERMAQFSAYSFCKAHASGYGVLAYHSTYLKAHYPVEFAAAIMNNHQGMYPTWVHLEESRRRGVPILGPCLNASSTEFTVEDGNLRVGLVQVRGLSEKTLEWILDGRKADGRFQSLADFESRIPASSPEMEALILAGALDFTGRSRPELLWDLHAGRSGRREPRGTRGPGLRLEETPPRPVGLRPFGPWRQAAYEFSVLDLSPTAHPLRWLCGCLGREGLVNLGRPRFGPGRRVRAVGVLAASRTVETRRGERMGFVTLDDEQGPFECVLFPDAYRREMRHLDGWGPYQVEGIVDEEFGVATIRVERLTRVTAHDVADTSHPPHIRAACS